MRPANLCTRAHNVGVTKSGNAGHQQQRCTVGVTVPWVTLRSHEIVGQLWFVGAGDQ